MNRTGKLLTTASALALALTLGGCSSSTPEKTSAAPAPKLYTFTSDANGFDTQTQFLDTGKSVVAFDAQFTPAYAQQALDYLKTKTSNPVRYVVVTHPNPDKFQGIPAFAKAGATSVASTATVAAMKGVWEYKKGYFVTVAKSFTDATYPALPTVDEPFADTRTLTVDGVRIDLTVLAQPGVSTTQTVAAIPALKTVIVGDLVHHDAHAWLEGGIVGGKPTPTLDGWQRDLDQVATLTGADWTLHGGRGTSTTVATAVAQQKAYLTAADQDTAALVAPLTAAQRAAYLADPSALVAQLGTKLTARFPSYQVPYLIGYGAYGLVGQHLAAR